MGHTVPKLKQLRLKLSSQQSTLLVADTKQIDRTQAHVEKKTHLQVNGPGDRNH